MINTILFDFDGTLVNTNKVIIESWQHTYRHFLGREESLERITACFGEPLLITMSREFPDVDPEESADVYRNYQKDHASDLVESFPGVEDLLGALKEKDYTLFIVTSRTRESAERYLKLLGIEDYFRGMISCDDTEIHKPHPEPIFCALRELGIDKSQAIMVGDSPFDIKCANNADVKSVMVGWGIVNGSSCPIEDWKADFEIENPLELLDVLEKIEE